ncbi:RNA-binding transcriptional accessory protein [Balneolaceae bacterium YR4-1]|uniref:RNA-binding transcriptional accessory protein n=1 Tax=Halalkalibaculum roseum TaxID=2709311 RepID=A0A6M1SXC5_9BACT|nr:Tex family protein [Halalkalibaculum roseum]NGP76898.1 RNA-binding transcriptional accessory protein [Halalkalibaculum roseum]
MTESQIFKLIASELNLKSKQVISVAEFLDDGATVPFLARYRQEATGGLNEEEIRDVRDKLEFHRTLEDRKKTILKSIEEQDKLTPELEDKIRSCADLKTLEDLYLPYKPKRKTKGDMAKEKGLEPLADLIWKQQTIEGNPQNYARNFVDKEGDVPTPESAMEGALHIVAEWINESVEVRDTLRNIFEEHAVIRTEKNPAVKERTNFEDYYDYSNKAKYLKPHQILAINRGERENILFVNVELWDEITLEQIDDVVIEDERSIFTPQLQDAVEDAYKRLLFPSLERELRNELTEKADEHAIETFATNLANLLMQPPLDDKIVMGIDPAFRTGCKIAVVDETGKYLEGTTVYPTPPQNKQEEAAKVINKLIDQYRVELIAIGNGTASRETEQFIAELIQNRKKSGDKKELNYMIVNEAGASVYSASKVAREEFPDLEAAQRGNISIARRVLDPLAELVKIDPKSIGVGLYQHDVNQNRLSQKLDDVVESCVNQVGVNLNTASAPLLSHISGLTKRVATNIIKRREEHGKFKKRDQIREIDGVGDFRFQQAAGFMRIPESSNPLDNTAIHPESYEAAEKLCNLFNINLEKLGTEREKIENVFEGIDKEVIAQQIGVGVPTLELIIENLQKPGRDPRENLQKPMLRQDIMKMEDLSIGQVLEGTVRNVVDFGAFIDIGVKQDGLLHISNMADRRVEDPHEILSVGDILTLKIVSLDLERGRIGLSLED